MISQPLCLHLSDLWPGPDKTLLRVQPGSQLPLTPNPAPSGLLRTHILLQVGPCVGTAETLRLALVLWTTCPPGAWAQATQRWTGRWAR